MPFNLCAHASCIVNDSIYMFGGTNGSEFFDKISIFSLNNQKMYEFDISEKERKKCFLKPKMASCMSYDPFTKNIYIFGGSGFEDESSSLLCLNS